MVKAPKFRNNDSLSSRNAGYYRLPGKVAVAESAPLALRASNISTKYLEALELQLEMARLYSPGRYPEGINKTVATLTSSTMLLAQPVFISPDIADALGDSMGDISPQTTLYPSDAPCEYGFAYIGGEEWPIPNHITTFTNTVRGILWAVDPAGEGFWFMLFGRSFEQDKPVPGVDEKIQLNDLVRWKFGVPLVQAADTYVDVLFQPGEYVRQSIDTEGKRTTFRVQPEDRKYVEEAVTVALTYIAAVWLFMKQRIAAKSQGVIDRATRRRLPPDYRGGEIVSIVHLRAIDVKPRVRPEATGAKWNVRTIRRAHWHNYWCEGKSKRCDYEEGHAEPRLEPRFLQQTVCGPAGAPLRNGVKLFAVMR